jgi:hypothetical protein
MRVAPVNGRFWPKAAVGARSASRAVSTPVEAVPTRSFYWRPMWFVGGQKRTLDPFISGDRGTPVIRRRGPLRKGLSGPSDPLDARTYTWSGRWYVGSAKRTLTAFNSGRATPAPRACAPTMPGGPVPRDQGRSSHWSGVTTRSDLGRA